MLDQIHTLDDLLFGTSFQTWHGVVFVQQGDVVVNVFLSLHHALQTVVQDHADFMGEGRVIRHTVWNCVGHDVAMTILMLQAFTIQGGASRGATKQEAACLHIASRPSQIADALEAEHRVVHIERHHDAVAGAVARSCCNPAAHAAGFVDTFLQNLTGFVFLVVHHLVFVDGRVLLASRVVNTDLAEQSFHTKGARFVHQDRYHAGAEGLVT